MSITLTLRVMGQPKASLTLDGGRIVLGRGPSSDVRIPDVSVSYRHASIRAERSQYLLYDEGSVNGSWVGGVRLAPGTPRVLRRGDQIRLGRVWIEVRFDVAAPAADRAASTRELALSLVAEAMEQMGDSTAPRVVVVEGRDLGEELRLEQSERAYVVGRSEECDLMLSDIDASRRHLQLTRRGQQIWLMDLGSRNGVQLGERTLVPGREVPWPPASVLRVANSVLALDEPVQRALQRIESYAEEAMSDEEQTSLERSVSELPVAVEASGEAQAEVAAEPAPAAQVPEPALAQLADLAPAAAPAPRKRAVLGSGDWAIVALSLCVLAGSAIALFYLLGDG